MTGQHVRLWEHRWRFQALVHQQNPTAAEQNQILLKSASSFVSMTASDERMMLRSCWAQSCQPGSDPTNTETSAAP